MEEVSIRIAVDLGLFNILVNSGEPQTLEDLTKATRADGVLLGVPSLDPLRIDLTDVYWSSPTSLSRRSRRSGRGWGDRQRGLRTHKGD